LLALGGVIIALVLIFSVELALIRANSSAIALIAATAVFLCVFTLVKPALSGLLGVVGVVSVVVSLVGAPFGAIFGVLLSVLSGNRCYAWNPDTDTEN
jgi:hypothetical protein